MSGLAVEPVMVTQQPRDVLVVTLMYVERARSGASRTLSNPQFILLSGEEAYSDRFGLLYGKGPLMLHALRQELGDQVFFTLLKSFISNFRFKWAETAQFIRITSVIAKKDYQPWFDRYLLGTESPKL